MRRKSLRLCYLTMLLLIGFNIASGQQNSNQDFTVKFYVKITNDKGQFVQGLSKENFSLFDNNVEQNIISCEIDNEPTSYAVLFDLSSSIYISKLNVLAENLLRFLSNNHKRNEYIIIGFANKPHLINNWNGDPKELAKTFNDIANKNNRKTALYDSCLIGIEQLQNAKYNKKVLLIISDGQDNASSHSEKDVYKKLKSSNVMVNSIGILSVGDIGSKLGSIGENFLNQLARISAGDVYFPETAEAVEYYFSRLSDKYVHYLITYKPSNLVSDGKWRKVKIKVKKPDGLKGDINIKVREGYFAPLQKQ